RQPPRMRSDDACDRGEAQAAAQEFRAEERLEDLSLRRFVHSAAIVADLDGHVRTGFDISRHYETDGGWIVDIGGADAHRYGSVILADGLAGVEKQVHQDLLDFGGIGL